MAAASTVLAAFMAGLAAGAFAGGRVAARLSPVRAVRLYAAIEIGIGVFALAVPSLLRLAHVLLTAAYADGHGGFTFELARLACSVAIVGAPAFVMGATYPLIVRVTGVSTHAAGSLYAANTVGAAFGATAAGFLLIRTLGTMGATLVAALGNLVVAVMVWRLTPVGDEESIRRAPSVAATTNGSVFWAALIAAAVAGFSALALEVAWTRTLAMVMGPTTYAFSAMVACFIGGLAAGSAAGAWIAQRAANPGAWIGPLFAAAALSTALATAHVSDALLDIARRAADPNARLATLLAHQFKWAALLIGPTAGCFGALFPMVLSAARALTPSSAANIYGANTLGAIGGSLAAGLMGIPLFGVRTTFVAAIALTVAAAVVAAVGHARRARASAALVLAMCAAAVAALGGNAWDRKLLSSGAYKYAAYLGAGALHDALPELLRAGTLRYYREGAIGTVAVRDVAGARSLSIDGKVDASNGRDMLTQRLLAHLPLLAHPRPKRIAIVGLGSGVTLGSALTYPIESAEAIEISPEVIAASDWFRRENRDALHDRRVRLVRGDARTHFRLGWRGRYDVIISEPSNPWMAGVAALFTREFFAELRSRLAPGGIVCQWTHTYDISREDLQSIVGTFSDAFPDVSLWLVGEGDLLMIGGPKPGAAAPSRVFASAPPTGASADLAASSITRPSELSILYLGDTALARRWSAGVRRQSDNRMALEFSAPAATVGSTRHDNASELLQESQEHRNAVAVDAASAGALLMAANAPRRAWPYLQAGIATWPEDATLAATFVKAAAILGRLPEAEAVMEHLLRQHPRAVPLYLESARLLAARGDLATARQRLSLAAAMVPDAAEPVQTLAGIAADAGDAETLGAAVLRLRVLRPRAAVTRYYEGVLHLLGGDAERARLMAEQAVVLDASYAAAWNLLGAALANAEAPPDAVRRAFERAVGSDPSDAAAYVNLATLDLRSGRIPEAVDGFAQALTLDPSNVAAREGLAEARRRRDERGVS